jgi:hypothetical protein
VRAHMRNGGLRICLRDELLKLFSNPEHTFIAFGERSRQLQVALGQVPCGDALAVDIPSLIYRGLQCTCSAIGLINQMNSPSMNFASQEEWNLL